jgi:hypothetical protein
MVAVASIADAAINMLAAFGAVVVARDARRADPYGGASRRIVFALHWLAIFFFMRALAWGLQATLADRLANALATLLPLIALVVAEGLLRRHAPRAMKIAIALASAVLFVFGLLSSPANSWLSILLLLHMLAGMGAVTLLVAMRDRQDLGRAENRSVDRLVIALVALFPLILTDFPDVVDSGPVRLGALGVLLMLYLAFSAGGRSATLRERLAGLGGYAAIAAVLATSRMAVEPDRDMTVALQSGWIGLAGLITAALWAEALGANAERRRPVSPLLLAPTPEAFVTALKNEPLVSDVRLLSAADLADIDHPALRALLAENPLLRRDDAPWSRATTDDGVERLMSLFAQTNGSVLMRLSLEPLAVVVFRLPAHVSDARTLSELLAAQRLAEASFAKAAPA